MSQTNPLTITTFELPDYCVVRSFGLVTGIVGWLHSISGNLGAGIQATFGGNSFLYAELCERTREKEFNQMLAPAGPLSANAVLGGCDAAPEIRADSTAAWGDPVFGLKDS